MSNARRNKREVRQIVTEHYTVGQQFRANDLSEYTDIPTRTIGRYLAQLGNVKTLPQKNRKRPTARTYEVIE